MKSELTALTRPRISGGVASCSSDPRMMTLMVSAAPPTASAARESQRLCDIPKITVATPKMATQINSRLPACRLMGKRAITSDMVSAPMAGAARSMPSPRGPVCRTSLAKIGISATAPPSRTTNRSSEKEPRSRGRLQTYLKPARTTCSERSRCSMRPGRTWRLPTNTRKQDSVSSVKAKTMPAPSRAWYRGSSTRAAGVNRRPPSAGPVMLAN